MTCNAPARYCLTLRNADAWGLDPAKSYVVAVTLAATDGSQTVSAASPAVAPRQLLRTLTRLARAPHTELPRVRSPRLLVESSCVCQCGDKRGRHSWEEPSPSHIDAEMLLELQLVSAQRSAHRCDRDG
jgi:hypothetical protein